jgi:hypothetical protein
MTGWHQAGLFEPKISLKTGEKLMLKTDRTCVMNMENAIRGARNPMNSWAKSDSYFDENGRFVLGENDLKLARGLCAAGSDERKFIRQIFVSVDITAPLYWWKEFDTYKVGTVSNSTSTMHKLHAKPIEVSDFSTDRMTAESLEKFRAYLSYLEQVRLRYIETGDKLWWDDLIQLLPSSYNQLRTVTMNYENLTNMHSARKYHKLAEWRAFCRWIEALPYANELIIKDAPDKK